MCVTSYYLIITFRREKLASPIESADAPKICSWYMSCFWQQTGRQRDTRWMQYFPPLPRAKSKRATFTIDLLILKLPSVLWRCWLGGRKGIRPVENGVVGLLVCLSVWSEMQTCIWPSWCHCHSLSLASVKSRLILPFWYLLTRVVPEKKAVKRACVLLILKTFSSSVSGCTLAAREWW